MKKIIMLLAFVAALPAYPQGIQSDSNIGAAVFGLMSGDFLYGASYEYALSSKMTIGVQIQRFSFSNEDSLSNVVFRRPKTMEGSNTSIFFNPGYIFTEGTRVSPFCKIGIGFQGVSGKVLSKKDTSYASFGSGTVTEDRELTFSEYSERGEELGDSDVLEEQYKNGMAIYFTAGINIFITEKIAVPVALQVGFIPINRNGFSSGLMYVF
ncbi:MAG: hypothetical protein ACLFQK_05415 [Fibrobacterota bacterium]